MSRHWKIGILLSIVIASFPPSEVEAQERVVVEERTAMFALSPRDFFFDAVGDLADLELLSIGRDPLPDGDLAPYCSSTNGAVVSVLAGPTIRATLVRPDRRAPGSARRYGLTR